MGGTIASVGSNLALIPKLGIYGAALGAIVFSLLMLGMYKLVERRLGIRWGLGRDLVMIGGACLVGYGILQIDTSLLIVKFILIAVLSTVYVWRMVIKQMKDIEEVISS
jgi:O-antigen/teichoic acid export membrane protein